MVCSDCEKIKTIKCTKCKTELFGQDIVTYDIKFGYYLSSFERKSKTDGRCHQHSSETYRCPKCFTVKKIKLKTSFVED